MTMRRGRRFKLGPLVALFLVCSVVAAPLMDSSESPSISTTALFDDYLESDTADPGGQEVEDSSSTLLSSSDIFAEDFESSDKQSPSSTIEDPVPTESISKEPNEDGVFNEEEDETDEEDEDEEAKEEYPAPKWLEEILLHNSSSNVILGARALEVGPVASEATTTETPVGYTVVKWTLIGVIVLIPVILLPALFLFTRGKSEGAKDIDAVLSSLAQHILLYPTGPSHHDLCLVEGEPSGLVQKDGAGELHYLLTPSNAVVRQETGQLLHLQTGLLFNPVPSCTYDRVNRRVVVTHRQDRSEREPNSNFVFDPQTGALYERCLALYYKEGSSSPDEGQWKLARSPVQTNPQQLAIRRARPEELPVDFLVTYRGLLDKWRQAKHAAGQAAGELQMQDQGFSPICAQLQNAQELKLSSDKKPAVAKREQSNPLVIEKRDFSQRQPEDTAMSPRGGEGDGSFKLPVPPDQATSSSSPKTQPTEYGDAKSQLI